MLFVRALFLNDLILLKVVLNLINFLFILYLLKVSH